LIYAFFDLRQIFQERTCARNDGLVYVFRFGLSKTTTDTRRLTQF